jgi:predicted nucleic acid-binding protein
MIIVLDASSGIEISLNRNNAQYLDSYISKATKIITSDLYKSEVANVIWKYVNAKLLDKEYAIRTLQLCEGIIDEYIEMDSNNEEALNEGIRLNHSVYDLLYLTIARRVGGKLATMDKKLKKLAIENGIDVI